MRSLPTGHSLCPSTSTAALIPFLTLPHSSLDWLFLKCSRHSLATLPLSPLMTLPTNVTISSGLSLCFTSGAASQKPLLRRADPLSLQALSNNLPTCYVPLSGGVHEGSCFPSSQNSSMLVLCDACCVTVLDCRAVTPERQRAYGRKQGFLLCENK